MSDLFDEILDNLWHEEVSNSCEEYDGGLQECEIFYCPHFHVNRFSIPLITGTFTSAGTISENITCKNRRSFERIEALTDINELNSAGEKSTLKFYVLGVRGKLIGMKRITSRLPGIYIVRDNNGRMFVFGNNISPGRTTQFDISTGQKEEDNSGATISISSNMIFFEYTGVIPPYRESDFSDEFSFEFF